MTRCAGVGAMDQLATVRDQDGMQRPNSLTGVCSRTCEKYLVLIPATRTLHIRVMLTR